MNLSRRSIHLPSAVRAALLFALLLTTVALTACGSSSGGTDTDRPERPVAEAAEVSVSPGEFDPGRIFRETIDGVVSIRTIYGGASPLGARGKGGSGFVLSDEGEVITNAHVVSEETGDGWKPAERIFVEFTSGDILPARVLGVDLFSDVALLRVDPAAVKLSPLELADSDRVAVGAPVAVIGSPFGEDQTLTTGVVSQIRRSVRSLTEFEIQDAIQTDASINPGNSGGPMLDAAGRVIAIAQQMRTGSGASDGIGFGVPSNAIRRSAEQLREQGQPSYAYIGVSTEPLYPQLAEELDLPADRGAMIAQVLPGGPAARAGLRGGDRDIGFQAARFRVGGDVIVKADGTRVESPEDLGRVIARQSPGDTIEVEVVRDGDLRQIDVKLGERPDTINP